MFSRGRDRRLSACASSHDAYDGTREEANPSFKLLGARENTGPSVCALLACRASARQARAEVKKINMPRRARATADQDIITAAKPASRALTAAAVAAAVAHEVLTNTLRANNMRRHRGVGDDMCV